MKRACLEQGEATEEGAKTSAAAAIFRGYPPPGSNCTYTPNQFFDVVLKNHSRGVVRLVGYMLRRVLGFSDGEGNPKTPKLVVTYNELIEKAGVSRSTVRDALDEALKHNFITCLREPQPKSLGSNAISGLYELKWDESGDYITDLAQFKGFFAGSGHFTYVPDLYFDHTIKNEPLSVIRVVGAILRHTIGFQTKFGLRRENIKLSLTELQKITNIASRGVLSDAVQTAVKNNHICRVKEGVFNKENPSENESATYSLLWRDKNELKINGSNRKPDLTENPIASGETPRKREHRFENRTYDATPTNASVRNPDLRALPERLEIRTEQPPLNGSISGPASVRNPDQDRFENRTLLKRTDLNNNNKEAAAVSVRELLEGLGFDSPTSHRLAESYPQEVIKQQVHHLEKRNPKKNKLGLLRKAIEENWAPPEESPASKVGGKARAPSDESAAEKFAYSEFLKREAELLFRESSALLIKFREHESRGLESMMKSPLISKALKNQIGDALKDGKSELSRFKRYLVENRHLPSLSQFVSDRRKRVG